jgi:hypothetical protein
MNKSIPKLFQNVFEARYEHGYRYLDRCGDAMIIFEQALPAISNNKIWMPEEMVPTGARMKCPELEITLVFDAYRLCIDQNPADTPCPFEKISQYTFATLCSKFEINKITRFGNRKRYIIATDSIEQAEALSVKEAPFDNWPVSELEDLKPRSCEVANVFENADRTKGVRFSVAPIFKIEAPLSLDKRLTMPPHLLDKGQREALINQIKLHKQREKEPLAGLQIDIDYWFLNPEKVGVEDFLNTSQKNIDKLIESL